MEMNLRVKTYEAKLPYKHQNKIRTGINDRDSIPVIGTSDQRGQSPSSIARV
jgi:hypothetical protein